MGRKSHPRIILTTEDIAELLGMTPALLRLRIFRKEILFTGDTLSDLKILIELVKGKE